MKAIEDKILKTPDKDEKVKIKTVVEVKKEDIKEEDFTKIKNPTLLQKEHPRLAQLYTELRLAQENHTALGARSYDLRRLCEQELELIRAKIREYKKNEGITREDDIRWITNG